MPTIPCLVEAASDQAHLERRRHARFPTNLDIEAWWQDEFGDPCARPALMKNASVGGFGLELNAKPPLGALLRVRAGINSVRCIVRHVRCEDEQFLVGVEVLVELNQSAASSKSLSRLAAVLSEAGCASRLAKDARVTPRSALPRVDPPF